MSPSKHTGHTAFDTAHFSKEQLRDYASAIGLARSLGKDGVFNLALALISSTNEQVLSSEAKAGELPDATYFKEIGSKITLFSFNNALAKLPSLIDDKKLSVTKAKEWILETKEQLGCELFLPPKLNQPEQENQPVGDILIKVNNEVLVYFKEQNSAPKMFSNFPIFSALEI